MLMNDCIEDKVMDLMDEIPWLTASIAMYVLKHDIDIFSCI